MIKKILYYSNYDFSEEQGGSINEFEFCKTLFSHFSENAYFAINERNNSFLRGKAYLPDNNIFYVKELRLGMPIMWFSEFFRLLKIIHINKIDLIVTRVNGLIFPLAFVSLFTKRKIVIKTAGTSYIKETPKGLINKFYSLVEVKLRKFIFNQALCIDVPTFELSKIVRKETANKNIFIIPNGTNTEFFQIKNVQSCRRKYGIPYKSKVLGFVGTWPSEDGGLHLLKIAQKLEGQFESLKVVIAGQDPNMDILYQYVKEHNLEKVVLFLGKLPYAQMPEVISTFDVGFSFVPDYILKRNGNSSQKTRQYLSCGIPVVTVASGNEFIKKNNFLGKVVDSPDDMNLIVKKTLKLLTELNSRTQKEACREFAVNNLSNYSLLQQRLKIWNSLLEQ